MTKRRPKADAFSPGPWKVDGGKGKKGERYVWTDRNEKGQIGTHEVCVAVVKGRRLKERRKDFTHDEIVLADAHLIGAVTELLAGCRALADLMENPDEWPDQMFTAAVPVADIRAAHAALAKARVAGWVAG